MVEKLQTRRFRVEYQGSQVTHQYRLNQWMEIIRECRSSGQTVSAWCAEHDINPKSYYYWLKRVRMAACEALPSLNASHNPIVPVNMPFPSAGSGPKILESSSDIVLHLGTVTLEIRNSASAALIESILRVMQNVR